MESDDKSSLVRVCLVFTLIVAICTVPISIRTKQVNDRNSTLEEELTDVSDKLVDLKSKHNKLMEEYKVDKEESNKRIETLQENNTTMLDEIEKNKENNSRIDGELKKIKSNRSASRSRKSSTSSNKTAKTSNAVATAYDLSVNSCGKPVGHPSYGITASGKSLVGHTWDSARSVAADPNVYPMGSKLRLTFVDEGYTKYNGIYTVVDTGGAVKGNIIDVFLGDFQKRDTDQSVWNFGRRNVKVELVK